MQDCIHATMQSAGNQLARYRSAAKSGGSRLHATVYSALRRSILQFALRPGAKLTELDISKKFGVSRTPVREALRMLDQEGLVVAVSRSGYFVREFDLKEMDMWYETRIGLEQLSVTRAASIGSSKALTGLCRFWFDRPNNFSDLDADEYVGHDERFHETLAAISGNTVVLRFLREVNSRIRIIRRLDFTDPLRIASTYDEHSAILRLLLSGDGQAAGQAIVAHIQKSQDFVKVLAQERLAKIYLS